MYNKAIQKLLYKRVQMPTYQNNQPIPSILSGPHGEAYVVAPGDSIEVPFYIVNANFTKTSDTPLTNRVTSIAAGTLASSAVDHILNANTRKFIITQITGTVTVRPQLDTALAVMLDWTSDDPVILFDLDDYPCEKLRLSGVGSCTVLEYAY